MFTDVQFLLTFCITRIMNNNFSISLELLNSLNTQKLIPTNVNKSNHNTFSNSSLLLLYHIAECISFFFFFFRFMNFCPCIKKCFPPSAETLQLRSTTFELQSAFRCQEFYRPFVIFVDVKISKNDNIPKASLWKT